MQNSSEQLLLRWLLLICIANMSLAAFALNLHFLVIVYSEQTLFAYAKEPTAFTQSTSKSHTESEARNGHDKPLAANFENRTKMFRFAHKLILIHALTLKIGASHNKDHFIVSFR